MIKFKPVNFSFSKEGKEYSLVDFKGKYVLLYFYPRDNTPGCTKEACAFRDKYKELQKYNVEVFGVSKDSPDSHQKFSEKYDLPFTLISDPDHNLIDTYHAWQLKKMAGKEYYGTVRMSYLIDPDGNIAKIYNKVKPETHAEEVLQDVKNLLNS